MDSPSMYSTVSNPPDKQEEEEEEEEELELGLTLGAKTTTSASRSRSSSARTSCRILTAKDFPSLPSTRTNVVVAAGTKRAAADSNSNSSNQMVVGWPPVRSFRINNLFSISKDNTNITAATTTTKSPDAETASMKTNQHVKDEIKAGNNANSDHDQEQKGKQPAPKKNSGFVKVKMDGDPIGRKVDLSAHHSYESLAVTLELMFQKPTTELSSSGNVLKASKLLDGSSEFSLTYEDKDGDWMLVGDVPWRMFFDTVKRLRIMRTSMAKELH